MSETKPPYNFLFSFWDLHQKKEALQKAESEWEKQQREYHAMMMNNKRKEEESYNYTEEDDVYATDDEQSDSDDDDTDEEDNDTEEDDNSSVVHQENSLQPKIDSYLIKRKRDDDLSSLAESVKAIRVNDSCSNMAVDEDL
jgi:hypothetical protein